MKNIKFRGKKKKGDRKWVYGSLLQDEGRCYVGAGQLIEVEPETVGQYTGLKDKNDKEIYEGDIIKWTKPKPDYLLPENGMTVVEINVLNDSIGWEFFSPGDYGEIIGNKIDNPELLENK
jgi:uncharacterized phage protein (TIGR01671 family)